MRACSDLAVLFNSHEFYIHEREYNEMSSEFQGKKYGNAPITVFSLFVSFNYFIIYVSIDIG